MRMAAGGDTHAYVLSLHLGCSLLASLALTCHPRSSYRLSYLTVLVLILYISTDLREVYATESRPLRKCREHCIGIEIRIKTK